MKQTEGGAELSKMQKIRKRELRRAMNLLHERIKLAQETSNGMIVYGLRAAITILEEMRKQINAERLPAGEEPQP